MQTLAGSPTHLTRPGGRPQPPSARPDQTATPPTTDRTSLGPAEADVPLPPMLPGLRSNFGNRRPDPERAQQVGEALQDEGGPARGLSRLAGEMVGGAAGRVAGAALCAPVPPAVPICSLVGSAVGADLGGRAAEALYDNLPSVPQHPLENLGSDITFGFGA